MSESLKDNWKRGENLSASFVNKMASAVNGLTLLGYNSENTGQLNNTVPAICLAGGSGRGAIYTLDLDPVPAPPPGIIAVKAITTTENTVYVIVVDSIPASEVFSGWVRIAQPGIVYDILCESGIEIGDYAKTQSSSSVLHFSTKEDSTFTCVGARNPDTYIAQFIMNSSLPSGGVPKVMVENLAYIGFPTAGTFDWAVYRYVSGVLDSTETGSWAYNVDSTTIAADLVSICPDVQVRGGTLLYNNIQIYLPRDYDAHIRYALSITDQDLTREPYGYVPKVEHNSCEQDAVHWGPE